MISIDNLKLLSSIQDTEFNNVLLGNARIKLELDDIRGNLELINIINFERFVSSEVYLDDFDEHEQLNIGRIYMKHNNFIAVRSEEDRVIWREFDIYYGTQFDTLIRDIRSRYTLISTKWSDISFDDKKRLIDIYFGSMFRNQIQDKPSEDNIIETMTDIDLTLGKFRIITSTKEFFFKAFTEYLRISKTDIPFMNDIGSDIKNSVQTKNNLVRRADIEFDINFFINHFNLLYKDSIEVQSIDIKNEGSKTGGDKWIIDISAKILHESVVIRLNTQET